MSTYIYEVRAPQIATEKFDDEVMIVNMDKGNYYSLTATGAVIWDLIERGANLDQIVNALKNRYTGDAEKMSSDTESFINSLIEEHLVVRVEQAELDASLTQDGDTISNTSEYVAPLLERYTDMQELLLIDPIHEVNDEQGWPKVKP